MIMTTQDLLVIISSFGLACLALNIYKITRTSSGNQA